MNYRKIHKTILGCLMAVVASFGAIGDSQAGGVFVTGTFDPQFGAALPGVGFNGTATFVISDSCIASPYATTGSFFYAGYNCGLPHTLGSAANPFMSLVSAHVDFYDLLHPSTILGSVNFGSSNNILGMYLRHNNTTNQNEVLGVQSGIIGSATSTLPNAPSFYIQFGSYYPDPRLDLEEFDNRPIPSNPGDRDHDLDDQQLSFFTSTTLYLADSGCSRSPVPVLGLSPYRLTSACLNAQHVSNAAATRYVPEPGSLALVIGALVAGWSVRRQRK